MSNLSKAEKLLRERLKPRPSAVAIRQRPGHRGYYLSLDYCVEYPRPRMIAHVTSGGVMEFGREARTPHWIDVINSCHASAIELVREQGGRFIDVTGPYIPNPDKLPHWGQSSPITQ